MKICVIILILMLATTWLLFSDDSTSTSNQAENSALTETTAAELIDDAGNSDVAAVDETTLTIASDDSAAAEVADKIGVFTAWDFIRMVLVLGAVIGVIYLVFILLKRSGSPKIRENRLIRVLSSKVISSGKAVHLLEVGNQVFLVGAAENTMSLLSEIDDKETLDGIRLQAATAIETEKRSFAEIMSQMFGKDRAADGVTVAQPDPVGFLQQQRRRLKQI